MLTGFASAAVEFGRRDKKFRENLWNYYLYCRENDMAMTHTLINPQVDR
jgi:4-hydroxyphenylacetate 3-monooxygenase